MNGPKNYKAIMLSSTFTDLKEHRQAAIDAIANYGFMPRVMEFSGANAAADVIDTSLQMVRDAVAYVGVIGLKYGQTPDDSARNPDNLSITELEFNEAIRLGRPIVLFIMSDDHDVKKAYIESDPAKQKKLDAFRDRAKPMRGDGRVHRVYETFESLEKFSSRVAIAIGNLVRHLDQPSPTPPKPAPDPGPRLPISNVPIAVPHHFLGRDDDLAAIDHALKRGDGRAAVTALHGLRGVGKTTLAAAYAERHSKDYRATWWIRAETDATMRADLVGLGIQLGWVKEDMPEEAAVTEVLDRLTREGQDILLVYDNAISPVRLTPFLVRRAGPRIIITSNAPNWGRLAAPVEIEVWPTAVGADFLIARTGRKAELEGGLALPEALDGLPLAHEQAAAYCERIGISLADYLNRFRAAPAVLLDDTKDASQEYHDGRTVAKTFALAIEEAGKHYPAAAQLIIYAAVLAAEPIPLFLFSDGREEFGKLLAAALAGDGLDEALGILRAFALVDRESILDERDPQVSTDSIRLHRLVREVATAQMAATEREGIRHQLVRAMLHVYPDSSGIDPSSWPRVRRLDAIAVALVSDGVSEPSREAEEVNAILLHRLGAYRYGALGAYADACPLLERVLAISEKLYGPEDRNTAGSLNNLGELLRAQGNRVRARPLLERALEVREKVLGPRHPVTATSLNNLGVLLQEQGDVAQARLLFERALDIREKELGPDDPITAISLNNLAGLLESLDDVSGARLHYERALGIWEIARGPNHPDTAACLNNLGYLLQKQGDLPGARHYFSRALTICENALGVNHPDTMLYAQNTALLLDKLGLIAEAQILRKRFNLGT